jgi:O-phosphoseryl-tRNA(Cys) synthetase
VYGATLDVEIDDVEMASGVAGPHTLDAAWEITDPWAGWGFGLERLAMVMEGSPQIGRFARSLIYLDGARLNVQTPRNVSGGGAAKGPRSEAEQPASGPEVGP